MIYLVENNFSRGDSYNNSIDSVWSSRELAEARINKIKEELRWFFHEDRVAFSDVGEEERKVIKRWSPMIGWEYDGYEILEFKIDEA